MRGKKQTSAIRHFANSFLAFLDKRSQSKWWPLFVFTTAIAISIFCVVPDWPAVSEFIQHPAVMAKAWWLDHPFKSVPVEQFFPLSERHIGSNAGIASHLDKMTYRAFLPLLNQVFPFGIWTLVLAGHFGLLVILWFSYWIVERQLGNKVSGALTCWAVAACYAGQYGYHVLYFGDPAAVGMLVAALFFRNRAASFLLVLCAGFMDERAVTAAPLVLLFNFLRDADSPLPERSNVALVSAMLKEGAPVLGSALCYALVRLGMTFWTGQKSGTSMILLVEIPRSHFYNDYPQLFFKVFEFLWIFPLIFLVEYGAKNPSQRFISILFGLGLALAAFPAMVVWDLDRSLFYLLPGILMAICFLPVSQKNMRLMLLAVLAGNLLWIYPSSSGFRKIDQFISSFIVLEKK